MSLIKKSELKKMEKAELMKRLSDFRLELAKEKSQIAVGGSPSNIGRIREIRKTIAKILTILNSKEVKNG
ncbi:MAG: 50S ribosomal protein L29 [Candidatus Aenigmarchaeota archaeon]|nr:50S ribosomal protein L29 [Candidatus Aenigmarchaeota archaeon]